MGTDKSLPDVSQLSEFNCICVGIDHYTKTENYEYYYDINTRYILQSYL